MRETWIDEHTGTEAVARPEFRTRLRAELAGGIAEPAARRPPWKVIGWTAAAAMMVVATVAVVTNDEADRRVGPAGPTSSPTASPTTVGGSSLRDRLVDVEWTVVTIDGAQVTAAQPPTFILQSDGRLVGFDGCNQYGFDLSLVGGWTLTGDTLRLGQQIVSTDMSCADISNPVTPVTDGTRLELNAKGVLTLTSPSGRLYTATATGAAEPANELVVPAEGGPALAPTVVATVSLPTGNGAPIVALLPKLLVVLPQTAGRFDGTVLTFDRTGRPLPTATLDPAPAGLAGGALGATDSTLYVFTNSATETSRRVLAYQFDGARWTEVASTTVEQNGDGVFEVTGEGLTLSGQVVLQAQTPDSSAPNAEWTATADRTHVTRTDADGSTKAWRITEMFENSSIPPTPHPFNGGVLYVGNSSGTAAQQYVAILRRDGSSQFFRPNGWQLSGSDESTALFAQAVDGTLRLGVLVEDGEVDGVGGTPQIDWATGTVLDFPLGFSGIDKVRSGVDPVLGEPTADSGWFTVEPIAPGDEDCLAGIEMRVLHWGDLTIAFRKMNTPQGLEGELFWSWVVGDIRGSGFDSFREPTAAPAGSPTGLRTEDGFGVGTTIDELRSISEVVLSDLVNSDGSRSGTLVPAESPDDATFRGLVVDADGIVIGFGTTQSFC